MAYEENVFLKIDEIPGISDAKGYEKQIVLRDFNFAATFGESKASSGNATLAPITLYIKADNGARSGFLKCGQQNKALKGKITITQHDGESSHKAVDSWELEGIKVVGVSGGGGAGKVARDFDVTITVTNVKNDVKGEDENGKAVPTWKTNWKVKQGSLTS